MRHQLQTESKIGPSHRLEPVGGADKKYLQDGVAPQCGIIGLANKRVYTPNVVSNYKIPKSYVDSHSISNYGWVFELKNQNGEVLPK